MHFLLEKPSRIIDVTITVVNKIFIDDYSDLQAPKTRVLIAELTEKLVPFFKGLYDDSFEGIIIISLFNGSVGVNFELSLKPSSNVTSTTVVEALTKGNGTQALGFLELGEISAVEQIQPTTQVTEMISPTPSGMCLLTGRNRFFFKILRHYFQHHFQQLGTDRCIKTVTEYNIQHLIYSTPPKLPYFSCCVTK